MATKKKRASFGERLLDLIMPPKKKRKKSRKQAADSHTRAVARQGLARLKAQHDVRQGQRAADVLSAVGGPLAALEAALGIIDTLQALIGEAEEHVAEARQSDIGRRALLAERYDEIRLELERIINDAGQSGIALIGSGAKGIKLPVGNGKKALAIRPLALETGPEGIDLPPPESAFAENEELDLVEAKLMATSSRIARAAEVFVADAALLSNSILSTTESDGSTPRRPLLTHN